MSALVVSEEDVLATLVLYACRPLVTNVYATDQTQERLAWNAAIGPDPEFGDPLRVICGRRLRVHGTIEAAIADSERRYEVERCEREVLDAVEEWDGGLSPWGDRIRAANAKLRRARMVLAHAR